MSFADQQKLMQFITTKLALKETLMGLTKWKAILPRSNETPKLYSVGAGVSGKKIVTHENWK